MTTTNSMKLRQTFAANLKAARERAGLTQKTLAGRAGISLSYLHMLEACGRDPALPMIGRLARACGVSAARLLVGS